MKLKGIIYLGFLSTLVLLFVACRPSGPYVKVDGKTYTESDLEKGEPDRYANIRKNYVLQIKRALKSFGEKKLYEAVAKEKGLKDANAYRRSLEQNLGEISDEEVQAKYDAFKSKGQLQGKALAEVRSQIVAYVRSEKRRDIVQADQIKLKAQYGYEEGPVVRSEVDVNGEPTRGDKGASITIVEFSGYECPYCKKVQPTTNQLRSKYKGKIKWVLKDYPLRLSSIYAHISSACVYQQDQEKYWTYFDKLFSPEVDRDFMVKEKLDGHVATLGVDMDRYNACTANPEVAKEIKADHQEGVTLGVRGIPYFFINGRPLSGAQSIYAFEELISEELAK